MFDRHLCLAILLSALVVIPRSLSIAHAHSESFDDQYHLVRGLAQWRGEQLRIEYNDPPFGEMLIAMPLWISGCSLDRAAKDPAVMAHNVDPTQTILYGQSRSPETLLMLASFWKAILFLPGAGLIFHWCRRLYGVRSAWLALAAVLGEPTIAAHTSVAALDVLSAESILFACYLAWRYFESPTRGRLIATCVAIAAAMTIKQQGVIVLPVCVGYAALFVRGRKFEIHRRAIAMVVLLVPLFIWAFTMFDISRPSERGPVMSTQYGEHWGFGSDVVNANLSRHWPGGIYIASLMNGVFHGSEGHRAYLLGEVSMRGWWYYQLVAASVKVPIGIMVLIAVGIVLVFVHRVRFDEWSLLLPAGVAIVLLLTSRISIGFRHAIPCYIPLIMWASRCIATRQAWMQTLAWLGVIVTAIHGIAWHPDELSYTNGLWRDPDAVISDSNVDWGQSLKQIGKWLDAHPQKDQSVYAQLFIPDSRGVGFDHYVRGRDQWLGGSPPEHGILIVSPVMIWGGYVPAEWHAKLRDQKPIDIIGHTIRVYDLDQIR